MRWAHHWAHLTDWETEGLPGCVTGLRWHRILLAGTSSFPGWRGCSVLPLLPSPHPARLWSSPGGHSSCRSLWWSWMPGPSHPHPAPWQVLAAAVVPQGDPESQLSHASSLVQFRPPSPWRPSFTSYVAICPPHAARGRPETAATAPPTPLLPAGFSVHASSPGHKYRTDCPVPFVKPNLPPGTSLQCPSTIILDNGLRFH